MTETPMLTIETHGQQIQVAIDQGGMFHAQLGDHEFEADTLDKLKNQIRKAFVASRVEVQYINLRGEVNTVRGYHSGKRALLITTAAGVKRTISTTDTGWRLGALSEDEVIEVREIERKMGELIARRNELRAKSEDVADILNDAVGENLTGSYGYERRLKEREEATA